MWSKVAPLAFLAAAVIWGLILLKGGDPGSPPSFSGMPTASALLSLFGLVNRGVHLINDAEAAVPPNSLSPRGATLKPVAFAEKNGISNEQDVRNFDQKAQKILAACTYAVLHTGVSNPIAMRENRVACLYRNGYDQNDIAYIGGKLTRS